MESFTLRTYGRRELAQRYLPDVSPEWASVVMKKWIMAYPGLSERLQSMGASPTARMWTPAQVAEIVKALGEP